MNLGYSVSKNHWRADTQLIFLEDNKEQIKLFKDMFEQQFKPMDTGSICKKDIDFLFAGLKQHRIESTREAKEYISRLKSSLIIKTEKDTRYVMDLAVKITKVYGKNRMDGVFAVMAILLYYLQRHEHKLEEISEKLEGIIEKSDIRDAINRLMMSGYILKSEDVYRVNVEKLLDLK
jgi:predicted transcriptional regulator